MSIKYNLFKDAYKIKNSVACRYDSMIGYSNYFYTNGDVCGWDIYSNICMYGVWDNILFGTSLDNYCYISRSNSMQPIPAEKYHIFRMAMKLDVPKGKTIPTKGKLMWQTVSDASWNNAKSKEFDLNMTDQWYTYSINLGESQFWYGDITNLRIYPYIDGKPDTRFIIKFIEIISTDHFICTNTQCSFYTKYSHPCAGTGQTASLTTGVAKTHYTTVSGVSDQLIIDIDGYGEEHINLGNHIDICGSDMAKLLVDRISRIGIGQYTYSDAEYDELKQTITIYSGVPNNGGYITVKGTACQSLGFTDENDNDVSIAREGQDPATGFEYYSSHRLAGFEINALIDSVVNDVAYYHNPNQYTVEAGRSDYTDSMSASRGPISIAPEFYKKLLGAGKLIIDGSHPVNDCGTINVVMVNGDRCPGDSRAVLLRPCRGGVVKMIDTVAIPAELPDPIYTSAHVTYKMDVNWKVNKGDLLGFYNFNVLCPYSMNKLQANAVYFSVDGLPSKNVIFDIGPPAAQGVIGISYYARSNRMQKNVALDIDLGKRLNIEEIQLYGIEANTDFEYNIASCLDVDWQVNLYNDTHWHHVYWICGGSVPDRFVEHRNKVYGLECLSDCVRTADNGKVGDLGNSDFMGGPMVWDGSRNVMNSAPDIYSGFTTLGEHSYCYVNGDAEWLNGVEGKAEFFGCWRSRPVTQYIYDPISYVIFFPHSKKVDIHKTGIYFKESNNFKNLSMSYYLGSAGEIGNAEELFYNYVPSFNEVIIDGTVWKRGDATGELRNQKYEDVYFANPWPSALTQYVDGKCVNSDIVQTINTARFNVLEHKFDPVSCYGFKIHTKHHVSTKLIELEVYSRIAIKPSLVDNINIKSSVYGDEWYDVTFIEDGLDKNRINAYITGSPRYFKFELQSQDKFTLFEMVASVSKEDIKTFGCTETLLLIDAPRNKVIEVTPFEIENTYDLTLNLSVTIPSQLFAKDRILSWVKLADEDTTINGEIGPGVVVRKNLDHHLYLANGQVANNTPTYYLKNLIEGSVAYELKYDYKWNQYKVLHDREDIGYSNYKDNKVYTLKFNSVSSKYWKFGVKDGGTYSLESLRVLNSDDLLVDIDKIYLQVQIDERSGKFSTSLNNDGSIKPATVLYEDFSNDFAFTWANNCTVTDAFISNGSFVRPLLQPWGSIYMERSFLPGVVSFDLDLKFKFKVVKDLVYIMELISSDNEIVFVMELKGFSEYVFKLNMYGAYSVRSELNAASCNYPVPMLFINSNFTKNDSKEFILKIKRIGSTFTLLSLATVDGVTTFYSTTNAMVFPDRVSKIRTTYTNSSMYAYSDVSDEVSISYINITTPPVLSEREWIGFSFKKSLPINRIEFIKTISTLNNPVVYISTFDNNDYFCWAKNFTLSGNLSVVNSKIYANQAFVTWGGSGARWSYPWNPFIIDDIYDYTCRDNNTVHWIKYDFGAGNERIVNHVYFSTESTVDYPCNYFTTCYVYGTNTSNETFSPTDINVVFITSFTLRYYNSVPTYSQFSFNNMNKYRFIIFYVKSDDDNNHEFRFGSIKLYEEDLNITNSSIIITTSTYYNYLAIDLGNLHRLDFIRQYGDRVNLLTLFNSNTVDFSSSDTSDINKVNWSENKPVILFNFTNYIDTSVFNNVCTATGLVSLVTIDSAVTPSGHVHLYGGYLTVVTSSNFNMYHNEFTFEFRLRRNRVGSEGIMGIMSSSNMFSTFMFEFNQSNFLVLSFYSLNTKYELKSTNTVPMSEWLHIAWVRNGKAISLFINGKPQSTVFVGEFIDINPCNSDLIIGKVGTSLFYGDVDELRFINGYAAWSANFTPSTVAYTADVVGDKTNARWFKIPFLCGDGIQKNVQYIGVYPDIRYPIVPSGGKNCIWEPIGSFLSNYKIGDVNLAPIASILNSGLLSYTFDNNSTVDWSSLYMESTTVSGIEQSDFDGVYPDPIWRNISNNFTAVGTTVSHVNKTLVIDMDSAESGSCVFNTEYFYDDCSCEVDFSHEFSQINMDYFRTSLHIYNYNESRNLAIKREVYSGGGRIRFDINGSLSSSTGFNGINLMDITKFKIEKKGVYISLLYYQSQTNDWRYLSNTNLYKDVLFEQSPVYFSLVVTKSATFPATKVSVNYITQIDYTKTITSEAIWGIEWVPGSTTSRCLGYWTPEIVIKDGPVLCPELLAGGKKLQSFEFSYLNSGKGGGGFSLVDNVGDEVLGIATFSDEWAVHSLDGWVTIDSNNNADKAHWCRVKATFDWALYVVDIEWSNLSTTKISTYRGRLIKQTGIEKLKIQNTLARNWGYDFMDIKFKNINVSSQDETILGWGMFNCLSGDSSLYGFENSWGFASSVKTPTLILDLEQLYNIRGVTLYHSPLENDATWVNTDYKISVADSATSSYTTIINVVGNIQSVTTHMLSEVVTCRIIKLEISKYQKPLQPYRFFKEGRDNSGEFVYIDGGFLRELEIHPDSGQDSNIGEYLNSEEYPIICMDLKDQFNITNHWTLPDSLNTIYHWKYKSGEHDSAKGNIWDNDDVYFQYSSDITSNPSDVAFWGNNEFINCFSYADTFIDYTHVSNSFILDDSVFFEAGMYTVVWQAYNLEFEGCMVLNLLGVSFVEVVSTGISDDWLLQTNSFLLNDSGYYTISVKFLSERISADWGIKNVVFTRTKSTSKWIAVKRNMATQFASPAYDAIGRPLAGVDVFNKLKVYASGKLRPTEYWWWWYSDKCLLENDSINTKIGRRALKINYPAINSDAIVSFMQGDCFELDDKFSIKDSLTCWLFISDVTKLDVTYGGISFGNFDKFILEGPGGYSENNQAFYGWHFVNMNLITGWNFIKLKFDTYTNIFPVTTEYYRRVDPDLNFRNYITSSFGMVFRGAGSKFYMLLDGIKIERNRFEDEVLPQSKGLCLTWGEYAEIPLFGANIRKGTLEMWLKLYTNTAGKDHFGNNASRTLFTLVTNNDETISLSLRSSDWFEVGIGNTKSEYVIMYLDPSVLVLTDYIFNIDDVFHLAFVWDSDGTEMENQHTVRIYINNVLVFTAINTWPVTDSKSVLLRLGGGNTYLANSDDYDGSAIFSNVKYYNFCKTSFDLSNLSPREETVTNSNSFVEISDNNVDFYNYSSTKLPLQYKSLGSGEKVTVYLKVDKTKMDLIDSLTGSLHIDWQLPV